MTFSMIIHNDDAVDADDADDTVDAYDTVDADDADDAGCGWPDDLWRVI